MKKLRQKREGFLPLLLSALSAIEALAGGAAGITKAVNDAKAARKQLEETLRHNRAMKGRGMYLAPYKRGAGMNLRRRRPRKKKLRSTRLAAAAITRHQRQQPMANLQLERECIDVPFFRGVFMRDTLPARVRRNEYGIANLDENRGEGTHWVAYAKRGSRVQYFDSFGNLRPPAELIDYFERGTPSTIKYNHDRFQRFDQTNCGHLCVQFLRQVVLEFWPQHYLQ